MNFTACKSDDSSSSAAPIVCARRGEAKTLHLPAMAKFTGTVRTNDLEGGFLELVTDGGEVYRLSLQGVASPRVGSRVSVTGSVERGGFGIHMTGPAIEVKKIEPL